MRWFLLSSLVVALACGDDDGMSTDVEVSDGSPEDRAETDAGDDVGEGDSAEADTSEADVEEDAQADVEQDSGPDPMAEFREVDGMVVFEAENYFEQVNDMWTRWYAFTDGEPDPDVTCRTGVSCGGGNAPDCNQYDDCDGDDVDPAEASGGTYLESLPDRRRDDSEPGTAGEVGVVNEPGRGPTLRYRVLFETPGRYYVWVHARGQGPAANGLHVGIDGTWPRNDLVDPSTMRLQFRNGWRWTQTRRGGSQHTGVSATDTVSLRDANVWLEVDTAGVHTIEFALREDGLEIDKVILSSDDAFEPSGLDQAETTIP